MKRVLKYIRKYTPALVLSLLLAGLTVLLTLYIPILTGNAVDLIIGKGQVDMPGIFSIMKKIAIAMIITAVGQWVMNTCNNYITYHVIRDIRTDAFAKLEILPLKYLDAHAYGDIVSRVIADVDTFADGLLMGFTQLFTGVLTILCTLGFMLVTNVPITLVVVCITPVSFLVAKFIATKTYSMFKEQSETRGEQTSLIEEMIDNQKIVNTFSRGEAVKSKFGEINGRLQKCSLKAIFFSSITNPATRFVNSLVYAGVGVFGALVAIKGGISVGRLSCFLSYANQYTKPFNEISGVVTELQNAFVCAGRIFELIDEEPQVPDAADARVLEEAQGNVDLKDVYFQYVPEKKLIQNFNLQVKPGQRVAIVGPTGCGKTTVINLLMRFYDVNSGSIQVDGTDIRDITRGSLRTNYGMVLQETWLRSGTIRDNICMGKPDATEEEVYEAAKKARCYDFIMALPDGFQTIIGEGGATLSGGEKQRISIARCILKDAPIVILDEATASVDTDNESYIQEAINELVKGKTLLVIAHRLNTIRQADQILVISDGRISEQGTHDELMAKAGIYQDFVNIRKKSSGWSLA